jgi:hypothetical protein
MKFAYADPPYFGCGTKHYGDLHESAADYDRPETHRALVERLCDEFADGWALSLSAPTLRVILPMCPDDVRVGAWTKPFASFKPGVNPAYAWEPVIFRGGRKRTRDEATVRDFCAVNIAMKKGFPGAKPEGFCFWVFDLLGARSGDEMHDLFPGSGAVGRAWEKYQARLAQRGASLFDGIE